MKRHEKFLAAEIGIEFKAALYFYTMLFFYFGYQLINGCWQVEIIVLLEMIASTYIMGYIQVFLMKNFDESECFTWKEILKIIGGSFVYASISYLGNWFERGLFITAIFFIYMLACYGCVCWLYSVKRSISTKELNQELEAFKQKKLNSEGNQR